MQRFQIALLPAKLKPRLRQRLWNRPGHGRFVPCTLFAAEVILRRSRHPGHKN